MARNQALEEPAHSLGGCLDPGDVLKLQVTVSSLSRVAGMRRPHRPASMKHRPHAEPGTCVTEQRTYFQGTRRVIPSAPSAAGVLGAPAGLPASHWGADSLDGGGFPCKADCVLTKSVFPGFCFPGSYGGRTCTSGRSDLMCGHCPSLWSDKWKLSMNKGRRAARPL